MGQQKVRLKSWHLITMALLTIALTGGGCLNLGWSPWGQSSSGIMDLDSGLGTGLDDESLFGPDLCKKENQNLTAAEVALTNKKAECDAIEARWNNHPNKSSAEADAIVDQHIACLKELPKLQEDVNKAQTAWENCQEDVEAEATE